MVRFPRGLEPVQGEKPIWYGRMSVKCMLGPLITFLLLLLLAAALGSGPPPAQAVAGFLVIVDIIIFIVLIVDVVRILSTEYFISNHRSLLGMAYLGGRLMRLGMSGLAITQSGRGYWIESLIVAI